MDKKSINSEDKQYEGIHYCRRTKKYEARACDYEKGKRISIGYSSDPVEATQMYREYRKSHPIKVFTPDERSYCALKRKSNLGESGVRGVRKSHGKWHASIQVMGHRIELGRFDSIAEAEAARKEAEEMVDRIFIRAL